MKGKVGGSTISRNRYGLYVKNWRTPINPQSSSQQFVRATLKAVAIRWATEDPEIRFNWDSYASKLTFYNRFGDVYTPNGFEVYCQCQYNSVQCGCGFLLVCPPDNIYDGPTGVILTSFTESMAYSVTPVKSFLGDYYILYASPGLSAARNYCRSDYRRIGVHDSGEGGSVNILTEYSAVFGAPVAGKRIFLRLIGVSKSNFLSQPPLFDSKITVTT